MTRALRNESSAIVPLPLLQLDDDDDHEIFYYNFHKLEEDHLLSLLIFSFFFFTCYIHVILFCNFQSVLYNIGV